MTRTLSAQIRSLPVAGSFTIARGSVSEVTTVIAEISQDGVTGLGECRPYARYDETPEDVKAAIEALAPAITAGMDRHALRETMAPGAARNAIDCALWDLEAKTTGKPVWQLAGLEPPKPLTTAYTISLGDAEEMAQAAANAEKPILKIKLGAQSGDDERLRAVRAAAPNATLLVDANEGWHEDQLLPLLDLAAELDVALVEQPLRANDNAILSTITHPLPICADESAHGLNSLDDCVGRYDIVNVKLDKTGGLTEALMMIEEARARNLGVFLGCMLASSLAMAPAMIAAQRADYVDLDGPLLLAQDHQPSLHYEGALIYPPDRTLWG